MAVAVDVAVAVAADGWKQPKMEPFDAKMIMHDPAELVETGLDCYYQHWKISAAATST